MKTKADEVEKETSDQHATKGLAVAISQQYGVAHAAEKKEDGTPEEGGDVADGEIEVGVCCPHGSE